MPLPQVLVLGAYFAVLVSLSVYGAHRTYLVYLYIKGRKRAARATTLNFRRTSDDTFGRIPTVDGAVADLQRAVCGRAADRRGGPLPVSARSSRSPGP